MKITKPAEYGQFLKKRRKDLGLTQVHLSEVSGLSVSFISDVENGKPTVELEKVMELAHLLGLDICLEVRR